MREDVTGVHAPKTIRSACAAWGFYPIYFVVTFFLLAAVKHPLTTSSPILMLNLPYWVLLGAIHRGLVKHAANPEYAANPELLLERSKELKAGMRPFFVLHTVFSVVGLGLSFLLLFGMVVVLIPFPLVLTSGALFTRSVFDKAYHRIRSQGRS